MNKFESYLIDPRQWDLISSQNNDVYYKYSDSGIWMPDTIHKPFLKGAVEEMESFKKRYTNLSRELNG